MKTLQESLSESLLTEAKNSQKFKVGDSVKVLDSDQMSGKTTEIDSGKITQIETSYIKVLPILKKENAVLYDVIMANTDDNTDKDVIADYKENATFYKVGDTWYEDSDSVYLRKS